MAISFIGQVTGTNTATLPAHLAGDLIIAFAFRDGSTTQPTMPAGWTDISSSAGANACCSRIAYIMAGSPAIAAGTWTNATSVVFHIYRGAHPVTPIGGNNVSQASSTTITYPTVTMTDTGGTSWVAGFAGHVSVNTALETAPTGMTARSTVVDATDEAAGHDTNGGVSSWSNTNVSAAGTAGGYSCRTVEIRVMPTYSYGSNLVTNGTFTSNTTGWTAFDGATLSATAVPGTLQIISSTGTAGPPTARQDVTGITNGGLYRVRAQARRDATKATAQGGLVVYDSALTTNFLNVTTASTTFVDFERYFISNSTSILVAPASNGTTTGDIAYFDNIELVAVTVGSTVSGSGAISGAATTAGAGNAIMSGAGGTVTGAATTAGAGASTKASAGGTIAGVATVAGAGESIAAGAGGTIAGTATVAGGGGVILAGSGAITGAATVAGAGSSSILLSGSGAIAGTATTAGAGASVAASSGGATAGVATVSGASQATKEGAGGTIAGVATTAGASNVIKAGSGSISGLATADSAGAAIKAGSGAIAGTSSASGAADGTILKDGAGAITGQATVTGAGALVPIVYVDGSGAIFGQATVTGASDAPPPAGLVGGGDPGRGYYRWDRGGQSSRDLRETLARAFKDQEDVPEARELVEALPPEVTQETAPAVVAALVEPVTTITRSQRNPIPELPSIDLSPIAAELARLVAAIEAYEQLLALQAQQDDEDAIIMLLLLAA